MCLSRLCISGIHSVSCGKKKRARRSGGLREEHLVVPPRQHRGAGPGVTIDQLLVGTLAK